MEEVNKDLKTYTIPEYLNLEKVAEVKHEYEKGFLHDMSGGSVNHGLIGGNIITSLNNHLSGKGSHCVVLNSDVRIFIEQAQSFVYPDAMVVCGDIETFEGDEHSVTNPILIVEVLSKSTGNYDRGDKFHKYCSLPSFQEYVLIDQEKPIIDVLFREEKAYWRMTTVIGLEKSIFFNSLSIEIPLRDIYKNISNLRTSPI